MIKVISIGGEPATGKTTLAKFIMSEYLGEPGALRKSGLVTLTLFASKKICFIGHYPDGEMFGGTDRLPMNAQPQVLRLLAACHVDAAWGGWVFVAEGDRLFNEKFFNALGDANIEYKVFVLRFGKYEQSVRQAQRGNKQSETWLRGRATKIQNITLKVKCAILDSVQVGQVASNAAMIFSEINRRPVAK